MPRSNLQMIVGALAAAALGIVGGWTLPSVMPVGAPAPTLKSPSVLMPFEAPSPKETISLVPTPAAAPDSLRPASTPTENEPPAVPNAQPTGVTKKTPRNSRRDGFGLRTLLGTFRVRW